MRDWCSECQFANYGGSQEPCYNCVTTYNKKPSEFTPATDGVRGVGRWLDTPYAIECSKCHEEFDSEVACCDIYGWPWKFCPSCGAKIEVSDDA